MRFQGEGRRFNREISRDGTRSTHLLPGAAAAMAMAALACFPACCRILAETPPENPIPPIGKLVDIGGRRLHLNCSGEGSPTVVLESSAGYFSLAWALVQPGVASFTRVCSYDRAGYAWSDAGPEPRTMAQIVFELHSLLAAAGEKGPYLMAGEAMGGAIVRTFAAQYPKDVAGMVLVESVHEDDQIFVTDKMHRLRETAQKREIPAVKTSLETPAERETLVWITTKVAAYPPGDPRSKLPPDLQRIWLVARKQDKYNFAANSEFAYLPEEMEKLHAETAADPQPLGKKPLIVLTREVAFDRAAGGIQPAEIERGRKDRQAQLARLSANSKLIIVKNSGHDIYLDQPQAVVDAIHQVVESARTGTALPQ